MYKNKVKTFCIVGLKAGCLIKHYLIKRHLFVKHIISLSSLFDKKRKYSQVLAPYRNTRKSRCIQSWALGTWAPVHPILGAQVDNYLVILSAQGAIFLAGPPTSGCNQEMLCKGLDLGASCFVCGSDDLISFYKEGKLL